MPSKMLPKCRIKPLSEQTQPVSRCARSQIFGYPQTSLPVAASGAAAAPDGDLTLAADRTHDPFGPKPATR
jgi:hypothetical protein